MSAGSAGPRAWLETVRILRRDRTSPQALRRLQTDRLSSLVEHASARVPFYRELYRRAGIRADHVRGPEDLHLLPETTKADLRDAGLEGRVTEGVDPASLLRRHTSGSTGEPFTVLIAPREYAARGLVEIRVLRSIGRGTTGLLVYLGPTQRRRRRPYQRLGFLRSAYVDIGQPPAEQVAALRGLHPDVLWAYPNRLRVLEDHIGGSIASIVRPRLLVTSAEPLQPAERRRLVAELGAEHFDFYGCIEVGRIAAECREHRGLHVQSDHVLLEAPADRPGPIRVTSLTALAAPFIRYRVGDLGVISGERCPCGSPFPLLRQLAGREADALHLPAGMVSPGALGLVLREIPWVLRFRTLQVEAGHLRVEVVADGEPAADRLEGLRQRLLAALGPAGAGTTLEVRTRDPFPADGEKFRDFVPYSSSPRP